MYGPANDALAHGANVVAGNESLGELSHSAAAYDVRHLTVATLGLLTAAAVGAAVWRLSGSRPFALWAAAGLLAVPAWTGHAFFNPKDIPAACGYTLVTVALILALCERPGHPSSSRYRLAIAAMLAGGIFIGVGTRLALWLPFAASLVTYAALRLGQRRFGGIALRTQTDLTVAAGVAACLGAFAVLYPNAAGHFLTPLVESGSTSANIGWTGDTLTAGQLLQSDQLPWWYLPTWIGASVPLLLGALAVLGAVLGIRALATGRGTRRHGTVWSRPELGLLLVLQQAVLLPLGAVITAATMYDGMRHHLYVLPGIAILAGIGAERFWSWARAKQPKKRWRVLGASLLGAALLVPMAEQTLLFPYNYAYVNPVAGIGGVNERWEGDYWFASAPEALSRTPRTSPLLCKLLVLPDRPDLHGCLGDWFEPFTIRRGDAVEARWRNDSSAVWVIAVKRAGDRPPDYCEEIDNVTRWLRGERVTMSYVLRCDPAETERDVVR
ncbi:MAG: hypothetical protein ACRDL6_04830 [Solirubrobacterales bacterium]